MRQASENQVDFLLVSAYTKSMFKIQESPESMRCKFKFNPSTGSFLASASAFAAVLAWAGASGADTPAKTRPAAQPRTTLEQQFAGTVRPFLQTYCVSCHGKEKPQAQLDLTAYANMDVGGAGLLRTGRSCWRSWPRSRCRRRTSASSPRPQQREAVIAWIRAVRQYEAQRNAGDPGPVLARRLSNAEYDYTIRDLTGVDLRPTREFPVDPANQEGFDNSGESLTLSPALMKKYVQAAKEIADHRGADLHGPGVRVPSGAGRDGPRQILHPAHRRFLQAAADRLSRTIFRPPGGIDIGLPWALPTPPCRPSPPKRR